MGGQKINASGKATKRSKCLFFLKFGSFRIKDAVPERHRRSKLHLLACSQTEGPKPNKLCFCLRFIDSHNADFCNNKATIEPICLISRSGSKSSHYWCKSLPKLLYVGECTTWFVYRHVNFESSRSKACRHSPMGKVVQDLAVALMHSGEMSGPRRIIFLISFQVSCPKE